MSRELKIFVVDTGPLITLAVAQSLDYLLYVEADIVIPDAVLHEATRDAARLGAQDIIDWVKAHRTRVEIAATKAYELYDLARVTAPNLRQPDLGERAAVEVIEEPDRLQADERGLLLCEETAVLKRVVVSDRTRIVEISTLDFLRILEIEQRIQSAEQVFELAGKAGRHPSRVTKLAARDESTRAAIQKPARKGSALKASYSAGPPELTRRPSRGQDIAHDICRQGTVQDIARRGRPGRARRRVLPFRRLQSVVGAGGGSR
jgi:hypothetical protein